MNSWLVFWDGKVVILFVKIFSDIFLQLSDLLAAQMQESGINLDFDQILDLESADLSGISSTDCYEIVSKPIIGR